MRIMEAVQGLDINQIRIRQPKRREVDIRNREELTMWCRRFGVTPMQLCSAIERVGNDAERIQLALRAKF